MKLMNSDSMKRAYIRPDMEILQMETLNDILEGIGVKSTGTGAGGITGGDAKERPTLTQDNRSLTWGNLWK